MENVKRNNLKNVLVALFIACITFLGLFTALPSTVSADEVIPVAPKYGEVLSDGTLYVSDNYSQIFKQPELSPEFQNHKVWEVGDEVQKGDELGGWYRVEAVYETTSLFNFNNVIPNSSQAIQTLRLFNDHLQTNVITIPTTWLYPKYPETTYYLDFYLPEEKLDITACTAYKIDEATGEYVANENTLFTYLWGTDDGMPTVTYDYDLVSVYKLTPVADPNYVAPEEPGDEPTVEPEEPGDEPTDVPEEETFGDKLNEWLKQMGENWSELSDAVKGLSVGAIIMLIGLILLIAKRK